MASLVPVVPVAWTAPEVDDDPLEQLLIDVVA
jgi:hypothetical protein